MASHRDEAIRDLDELTGGCMTATCRAFVDSILAAVNERIAGTTLQRGTASAPVCPRCGGNPALTTTCEPSFVCEFDWLGAAGEWIEEHDPGPKNVEFRRSALAKFMRAQCGPLMAVQPALDIEQIIHGLQQSLHNGLHWAPVSVRTACSALRTVLEHLSQKQAKR